MSLAVIEPAVKGRKAIRPPLKPLDGFPGMFYCSRDTWRFSNRNTCTTLAQTTLTSRGVLLLEVSDLGDGPTIEAILIAAGRYQPRETAIGVRYRIHITAANVEAILQEFVAFGVEADRRARELLQREFARRIGGVV